MGRFKGHMRDARAALHEFMSEPALYLKSPGDASPRLITARIHDKWGALGDLKGTNFNYAEVEDVAPRIIFWVSELYSQGIELTRGAFVTVERDRVYRVDNILPRDDQTVTATVVRLGKSEAAGFPVPEIAE